MTLYLLICVLAAFLLGGAWYAYRVSFFSPFKDREKPKPITNPNYDPYRPQMRRILENLQQRPFEWVQITSRDGLTLWGRYYHVREGAPLDLCFHGYRSSSFMDFSGGSALSLELEHNLLLVDQRAHGRSQGRTICFGLKERYDVLSWVEYAVDRFGPDTKIILYGISMGGATVLMASSLPLPRNVKGIVADCPYSNALDIICHVAEKMPIPTVLIKPFVILGARIYGLFDIRETDAVEAVRQTNVPIVIIHGDGDTFVPCRMSEGPAAANPGMVERHIFPGAEHGICYLVDTPRYHALIRAFSARVLN